MLKEFLLPALTVGLSEFGDKTQLAVLSFSSKFRNKAALFAAVMLAFVIVDGLAVLFGSVASKIIPFGIIKIAAGISFIAFGAYTLIMNSEESFDKKGRAAFLSVLGMIIMLEMGDKSQLVTILFAAEYSPLLVFLGVEAALALLTAAAIIVGEQLGRHLKPETIKYASGILFIAVGIISLV